MTGRLTVKNGKYYVVISYKDEHGKNKQKWAATGLDAKNNKRAAEEVMREIIADFNNEEPPTKAKQEKIKDKMLFGDYLTQWIEIAKPNLQLSTYASYKMKIKHIAPYFNERGITLQGITPTDIQTYYADKNQEFVNSYKVFVSKADGAAGQIGNPIPAKIIGKAAIGMPKMICTETFLAVAPFDSETVAKNVVTYMATKFFRFCVGIRKNKNMTRDTYSDTPMQDFTEHSDIDWGASITEIDKQLYEKYKLSPDEISFIETMIKPME